MKHIVKLLCAAMILSFASVQQNAQAQGTQEAQLIKIATLIPKGTIFHKYMIKFANELEMRSAEEGKPVKIKYYLGGVQGDEPVMVEKMRSKQLDGAVITAIGLGKIVPDALVYALPNLFQNTRELDWVRRDLKDYFQTKFHEKGYHLLGWGDAGYVYFFSGKKISGPSDMQGSPLWVWDDPIMSSAANHSGAAPVRLGVPDVLPSLATDLVDIVYGSPLVVMSLQWSRYVKYVLNNPIGMAVGATIIRKEVFDIADETQKAEIEAQSEKYLPAIQQRTRQDNAKSIKLLRESYGVQVVNIDETQKQLWEELSDKVHKDVVPSVISQKTYDKVKASIQKYRSLPKTEGK
jgi:TRAP-type C4-dicarboxylate transport system substrate-binding protein